MTARTGRDPGQHYRDLVGKLVVDDNATNGHIVEAWLLRWQLEPTVVSNGVGAMDTLWHGVASNRPYALALLNARMPDTDGLTLAAKIRERSELSATRIILLTSGDRPGDAQRIGELQLDAYLLKPPTQDEVLGAIHRVMSRADDELVRTTPQEPARTSNPLSILVAEDNELNALVIQKLLGRRGHHVHIVTDGRAALDLLASAPFDLVFLDLHMPTLDGFGVIEGLRARERGTGAHIPVVALTARSRNAASELWAVVNRLVGDR
jgi:two-component system, sensor histidine kinase and response regulator